MKVRFYRVRGFLATAGEDTRGDGGNTSCVTVEAAGELLLYDAMYTPEKYAGEAGPCRRGWGHNTFEAGAKVAEAAGVKTLFLFHRDPRHDDAFMDELWARAKRHRSRTLVAKEGRKIAL